MSAPATPELSTIEVLIFLKKVGLFGHLDLEDLFRLKEITSEVRFNEGDVIIRDGESGSTAYIIVKGMVEVYRESSKGEILLATFESTQYFGEMAIVENEPRSASVRAKTPCLLLKLNGPEFRHMLMSNASLSFRLMQGFSRRLRRMSQSAT